LTSLDQTKEVSKTLKLGVKEYMLKPLDLVSARQLKIYGMQRRSNKSNFSMAHGISVVKESGISIQNDGYQDLMAKVFSSTQFLAEHLQNENGNSKLKSSLSHCLFGGCNDWAGVALLGIKFDCCKMRKAESKSNDEEMQSKMGLQVESKKNQLSQLEGKISHNKAMMAVGMVGTPNYMAPEVVGNVGYGAAADWWSYGVCLFEAASGFLPFYGDTPAQIFMAVKRAPVPLEKLRSHENLKDLVKNLLVLDPENRLGSAGDINDITCHAFFEDIAHFPAPLLPPLDLPDIPDEKEERAYKRLARKEGDDFISAEKMNELFYGSINNRQSLNRRYFNSSPSITSGQWSNEYQKPHEMNFSSDVRSIMKRGKEYAGLLGPFVGVKGWRGSEKDDLSPFPSKLSVVSERKKVALAKLQHMSVSKKCSQEFEVPSEEPVGKKLIELLAFRAKMRKEGNVVDENAIESNRSDDQHESPEKKTFSVAAGNSTNKAKGCSDPTAKTTNPQLVRNFVNAVKERTEKVSNSKRSEKSSRSGRHFFNDVGFTPIVPPSNKSYNQTSKKSFGMTSLDSWEQTAMAIRDQMGHRINSEKSAFEKGEENC